MMKRAANNFGNVTHAVLNALLSNLPDLIFVKDGAGVYLQCNDAFAKFVGKKKDDIIGRTDYDLFPFEVADFFRNHDRAMLLSGETQRNEEWVDYPDGSQVLLDTLKMPFRGSQGEAEGILGISRDMTAFKINELKLRNSEKRFSDVLHATADWVWEVDRKGKYTFVSDQIEDVLGYSASEALGKTPFDFMPEDEEKRVFALFTALAKDKKAFSNLLNLNLHKNGELRYLETTGVPVFSEDGEWVGYRGLDRDVTEQKKIEAEITQAKEKAEAANLAKSDFLAAMSHELRTPMTSVLGFAELLLTRDLPADIRADVQRIKNSASAFLPLVNNILTMSKVEAGKEEANCEDFNLKELLDEILAVFDKASHGNAEIGLKLSISERLPDLLHSDPNKIRQVLINLIGNAFKFTEEGQIDVAVTVQTTSSKGRFIQFSVKDTGIGIADKDLDKIFDHFTQADNSTSRKYEGSGLGLSLSRKLVGLLGGELYVDSAPGEGSTFWFTIPLNAAKNTVVAKKQVNAADYIATRSLNILLAEDNRVNQTLVKKFIEKYGHHVATADDGKQAVAAVEKNDFDLVLMDVRMPEMDGIEATHLIRKLPDHKKDIPIIAATADAIDARVKDFFEAGMNDYVSKPFNWPKLLRAINRVLDEKVHILTD